MWGAYVRGVGCLCERCGVCNDQSLERSVDMFSRAFLCCCLMSQVQFQVGMSPHGGDLRAVNIYSKKEFIRGTVESVKGQVRGGRGRDQECEGIGERGKGNAKSSYTI